ncbi:hypothetical protein TgHK011_004371 [Trichoderma gracile]|nr:hypothetical protein TgHK011_004371 [Trichoderma gracile]
MQLSRLYQPVGGHSCFCSSAVAGHGIDSGLVVEPLLSAVRLRAEYEKNMVTHTSAKSGRLLSSAPPPAHGKRPDPRPVLAWAWRAGPQRLERLKAQTMLRSCALHVMAEFPKARHDFQLSQLRAITVIITPAQWPPLPGDMFAHTHTSTHTYTTTTRGSLPSINHNVLRTSLPRFSHCCVAVLNLSISDPGSSATSHGPFPPGDAYRAVGIGECASPKPSPRAITTHAQYSDCHKPPTLWRLPFMSVELRIRDQTWSRNGRAGC